MTLQAARILRKNRRETVTFKRFEGLLMFCVQYLGQPILNLFFFQLEFEIDSYRDFWADW